MRHHKAPVSGSGADFIGVRRVQYVSKVWYKAVVFLPALGKPSLVRVCFMQGLKQRHISPRYTETRITPELHFVLEVVEICITAQVIRSAVHGRRGHDHAGGFLISTGAHFGSTATEQQGRQDENAGAPSGHALYVAPAIPFVKRYPDFFRKNALF